MDNPLSKTNKKSRSDNWIVVKYLDARGKGILGAHYEVKTPDGKIHAKGHIQNNDGSAQVTLPHFIAGNVHVRFFNDPKPQFIPGRKSIPSLLPVSPNWLTSLQSQCKIAWSPLSSSSEWTWGLLQSEFNDATTLGQIISNTIITSIPLINHESDASELINYLHELIWEQNYHVESAWSNVLMTVIGLVPTVGSLIRDTLKLLESGTHIEQVIALFNYYQQGNGITWLKELQKKTLVEHVDYAASLLHKVFEKIINTLKHSKLLIPAKLAFIHQQVDDLVSLIQTIKKQINSQFANLAQVFTTKIRKILVTRIQNIQSGPVRSVITLRQTIRPPCPQTLTTNFLDCTPPTQNCNTSHYSKLLGTQSATTERSEPDAEHIICNNAVSMVTGEVVLNLIDFEIPGPIPLSWHRVYRSGNSHNNGLGYGWYHLLAEHASIKPIQDDGDKKNYNAYITLTNGKTIVIPCPTNIGDHSYNVAERVHMKKLCSKTFLVSKKSDELHRIFEIIPFTKEHDHSSTHIEDNKEPSFLEPLKSKLRLIRIQNTEGYGWTLEYNAATTIELNSHRPSFIDKVTRLLSDWGTILQIHYSHNLIDGITYEADNGKAVLPPLIRYKYNNDRQLINVKDRAGSNEKYVYKNRLLVERELKSGFKFYFDWDGDSPLAHCSAMRGDHQLYYCQFFWMQAQKRSVKKDSSGATYYYHYNHRGQLIEKVDPEHQVYRYEYNEEGQIISIHDPLERSHHYTYDSCCRLSAMTNTADQTTYFSYDERDNLCRLTKPGAEPNDYLSWHYEYNSHGRLIHVQTPTGDKAHYDYDHRGLLIKAVQPPFGEVRFLYNEAGQLVKEINEHKLETRYKYNHEGLLSSTTTPDQKTITYAYDNRGRLTKVRTPQGETEVNYNACGDIIRYKDPSGYTTQFEYAQGPSHMTQRSNSDGSTIKYSYDADNTLTRITNENGEIYQFQYDKNKRLVAEIGFDGREQRYAYNAAGELIYHEDSGLYETHFSRDLLGRLTQKSSNIIGETTSPLVTDYRYDGMGRLYAAKNAHSFVRFDYDASDNITHELLQRLNSTATTTPTKSLESQSIHHRYNNKQQRIETILPDKRKIKYHYNIRGLESISLDDKIITRFKRDALGLEYRRQQGCINTYWNFDSQNRLTNQHAQKTGNKNCILKRSYHYDARSLLTTLIDQQQGTTHFNYDPREKLKQITNPDFNEIFRFDPAGNLVKHEYGRHDNHLNIKHFINEENRLFLHGDRQFSYDSAGNLIEQIRGKNKKIFTQYIYNANQELAEVRHNSKYSTVYRYDALGRRISKQDAFGKTLFLWQGDHLLTEFRQHTHSSKTSRHDHSKTYIFEPNTFKPLALIHDNQNQTYHYHLDHLGTPQELTDENGKIVWQAKYYAYGSIESQTTQVIDNPIRFPGHYFDEETGFHYNRYRYYDPQSGRFIQQDPAGLAGSINLYQYCPNPIVWIDPLGLSSTSITDSLSEVSLFHPQQTSSTAHANVSVQFKQRIHHQGQDHDFLAIGVQPLKSLNIKYKQTTLYHFQDLRCDSIIPMLNQAIKHKAL